MHWGVKGLRFCFACFSLWDLGSSCSSSCLTLSSSFVSQHVKLKTPLSFLPLSNFYLASIVDPFSPLVRSLLTPIFLYSLQDKCGGWRSLNDEVTLRMGTLKRVGKKVWRSMDFCCFWTPHIRPGWCVSRFLSRREISNLSCFSLVSFCVTPRQI